MRRFDAASLAQENAALRGIGTDPPRRRVPPPEAPKVYEHAEAARAAVVPRADSEILFEKLDTDNSGELSLEELSFRLSDEGFSAPDISKLFAKMDGNKDGVLDKREFMQGFAMYNTAKTCGLQRYSVDVKGGKSTFCLPQINVSNSRIGEAGFNRVFEMIESDVALESLEMRSTQLPDGPVRRLARFAVRHPTLTSLDLSGNPITDVGGKALLQLVQKNRGVVSLKLEDTLVADNLIAKIQVELLTNKRSNKSRLRSGNGFSNDLQKARRQRQHTPAQRSTKQQHTAAAESAAPVVQEQPQQVCCALCLLVCLCCLPRCPVLCALCCAHYGVCCRWRRCAR
eukprot:TRINITY_DN3952_c0_g1_i2.p1 TRINITY_DN3952_c0_g1~~TRINITY_DN3952_c0_g1_i2.p1  ORF type:complete len:342 (-),score=103.59 TRINITY_DN3952_c0_g1_i2:474-1499(-)